MIFAFGFSKKYNISLLSIECRVLDWWREFERLACVDAHLWFQPPSAHEPPPPFGPSTTPGPFYPTPTPYPLPLLLDALLKVKEALWRWVIVPRMLCQLCSDS
jgi:hypothetical protein